MIHVHVIFRISNHPSICLSVFKCVGLSVFIVFVVLNVMTNI